MRFSRCLLTALLFGTGADAELKLPSIFSDNAVIQQGKDIPIWGWAKPGYDSRDPGR